MDYEPRRKGTRRTQAVSGRHLIKTRDVYFFHAEQMDMIKIGYAVLTWPRLSAAQTDCPDKLSLLGVIRCASVDEAIQVEGALHAEFAHLWVRGEWFRAAADLRSAIRERSRMLTAYHGFVDEYEGIVLAAGNPELRRRRRTA